MRKIIANGLTLKSEGMFYIVLEKAEDGSIIELMNEPATDITTYPAVNDAAARTALANKVLEAAGQPPLTDEEVEFMISYDPGAIVE